MPGQDCGQPSYKAVWIEGRGKGEGGGGEEGEGIEGKVRMEGDD